MVWVTKSMFFSNLKPFFAKWTFIFVHFWKIQKTFEKNDSLHSLRRPPSQYLRPYLYALCGGARMRDDETIMLTIRGSQQFCKRWGGIWGIYFFYNIGITIFRDVFDFIPDRFTFYPRFLIHIYWNKSRIPKLGHLSRKVLPKKIQFMSQKWGSLFSAFSHFVYTTFSGIFWISRKWAPYRGSFKPLWISIF